MAKHIKTSLALCIFTLAPGRASPQSNPTVSREDTQIWTDFNLSHPLRERTDLFLSGGLRWGRDASHLVYERASAGLSLKLGKHLTLSPYYSYFATQPMPGQDVRENRVSLDASGGFTLGLWTFGDRNVLERRFRDPKDSSRYRNRLEVERQFLVSETNFTAFVWDEVLYDWSFKGWVRNRLAAGVGKQLTRKISLDIFYLRQNGRRPGTGDLHVVGMTLRARV